jgi:CDP-diglyceride synthetase
MRKVPTLLCYAIAIFVLISWKADEPEVSYVVPKKWQDFMIGALGAVALISVICFVIQKMIIRAFEKKAEQENRQKPSSGPEYPIEVLHGEAASSVPSASSFTGSLKEIRKARN